MPELTIKLHKASFRKWLRGHQPDDVVGVRSDERCCPIAQYIKSGLEEPYRQLVRVGEGSIRMGSSYFKEYKEDSWIYGFIYKVDRMEYVNISAQEALEILGKKDRPWVD